MQALARRLSDATGWPLTQVRFYTGIPDPADDPFWHHFWSGKLAVMGRQGIRVFSRSLRCRNKAVRLPDGSTHTFLAGEEKGIDVRIALDVIRLAHRRGIEGTDWIRIDRPTYDACLDRRDYRPKPPTNAAGRA